MASNPPPRQRIDAATHFLVGDAETEGLIAAYASHRFRPHYHRTWAVGVALGGRHWLWCEGQRWEVGPGDAIILPPGTLHTGAGGGAGPWAIGMLFPSGRALESTTGMRHAAVVRGSALALEFGHELRRSSLDRSRRTGTLLDLASALATSARGQAPPAGPVDDARILEARALLDAWSGACFRVSTLASRLDLHPSYLGWLFRRAYGIGPYAYWLAGRIDLARDRLRAGTRPGEVAHALGFADQAHFTRSFRRTVGIPPGAYRESLSRPLAPAAARLISKLF